MKAGIRKCIRVPETILRSIQLQAFTHLASMLNFKPAKNLFGSNCKTRKMKKRYYNSMLTKTWLALALLAIFSTGCKKDFFDKQPLDAASDATFWKTEGDAQLALVGCYYTEA